MGFLEKMLDEMRRAFFEEPEYKGTGRPIPPLPEKVFSQKDPQVFRQAVFEIVDPIERNLRFFYKKAEEYYKLALEINPGDVEVYITLAVLQHYRLGDTKTAEETLLAGLARTQNNEEIMIRLIRFYNTIGDKAKEKNTARLLLQLHPDNEAYQREWGSL